MSRKGGLRSSRKLRLELAPITAKNPKRTKPGTRAEPGIVFYDDVPGIAVPQGIRVDQSVSCNVPGFWAAKKVIDAGCNALDRRRRVKLDVVFSGKRTGVFREQKIKHHLIVFERLPAQIQATLGTALFPPLLQVKKHHSRVEAR